MFLPSLINLLLPLFVVTYLLKGKAIAPPSNRNSSDKPVNLFERNLIFYLGLGLLIAVPAFKTITHLPPFMGIRFGLGILWVVGELIHRDREPDEKKPLTLVHALKQIDMASIVFFIGILLAVATLEHTHVLEMLAKWLDQRIGRQDVIVVLLGILSAIVDNVPLVAASTVVQSSSLALRPGWLQWGSNKFTSSGTLRGSAVWPWLFRRGSRVHRAVQRSSLTTWST